MASQLPDIEPRKAAQDESLQLNDQRRMAYRSWGPVDGFPLIALHGTPGSRLLFSVTEKHAHRLGLRIIAPDRWGYGGTDPHPAPDLRAFVADIAVFTRELGLDRFAVMGVSGGGPYATAVAACLPGRVAALALVAPVGPIAHEADREITAFHRFCFGPFARSRLAQRVVFGFFRRALRISAPLGMRVAMARIGPADERILASAGVTSRLAATFNEGLRPGTAGPCTDLAIFGKPWAVPLADVRAPSRLWIGDADRNVPISAAKRLAARLPDCTLIGLPGEGHLWVSLNYAKVLGWIASCVVTGNNEGAAEAAPS